MKPIKGASLVVAGGVLGMVLGVAQAQDAEVLEVESQRQQRQALERERVQADQLQPRPDVRLPRSAAESPATAWPADETPCFVIDTLLLEAAPPARRSWDWLAAHVTQPDDPADMRGRCLGAQGVGVILARLQQALLSQGWITTRITAPPQDLSTGQLLLVVHEGRVSQIRFAQGHGQRATRFNTLPIRAGDVLNLRDLEQGLENLKRVPTVQADIAVEPGTEPGLSELVIRHEQAFPFRLHVSLDDSGQRSTGTQSGHGNIIRRWLVI